MKPDKKPSIKKKLINAMMLASFTVLLVTVAAFMLYDLLAFRAAMVRNLAIQARMLADNTTAALAFLNEKDAEEVLSSLRAEPHIVSAAIFDERGKVFATFPLNSHYSDLPTIPQTEGYSFESSSVVLFQPIHQTGTRLGTLFVRSDLGLFWQRLKVYAAMSALITLGSLLVVFWLSNILQRRISDPIIALADVASKVTEQGDYSLRAPKLSDDELGLLTDTFNQMLRRIQNSDEVLRAREAQFRLVTDQAPVSLAQVDSGHRYKFVNKAYAARYGRKPHELIGQHAKDIVGLSLFEKAAPYVQKALAGEAVQFEIELPDQDGLPSWSHAEYTPEVNPKGEVVGIVAVHTNITSRKRNEMELEKARDSALAASRAKDDFLAALSHELRTPLNPVLLVASEAAADSNLSSELRANFEMILRNVTLEARLIDDLLDLTRITRGKLALEKVCLDAHQVLEQTLSIVRAEAVAKDIHLGIELTASDHFVLGDSVRLQQVFWNVLKNAVKFTPHGGSISISTLSHNQTLVVRISDTGIGIPPDEIQTVFDAFAQGGHARNGSHKFGGLGLGLAISRSLVGLHSGSIEAHSLGRGKGAIFTVSLPLAGELTPQDMPRTGYPPPVVSIPSHPVRILLIEDHEATRLALSHLLARRHFEVCAIATVSEARALATGKHFDLVISDIGLPDGNGYELMSELSSRFGLRGVALTGYGTEEDVARSQKAGFIAHLTKPVRIQSLDAVLASVLAGKAHERS